MRVVAQCEIDPFCRAVLAKHWPDVPRFEDVRELTAEIISGVLSGDARGQSRGPERPRASVARPTIDLIAGGFPCQDVSSAGKGAGIGGARSGLWREMARLVAECRPAWVLVENVPALRSRGADRVLADLEAIGFDAWPLVVGAWAVGAPHRRDRVWIVAHADGGRLSIERFTDRQPEHEGAPGRLADGRDGESVADAGRERGGEARHVEDHGRATVGAQAPGLDQRPREVGGMAVPERDAERHLEQREPARPPDGVRDEWEAEPRGVRAAVADAAGAGRETERDAAAFGREDADLGGSIRWPARPGEPQHEWEDPRLVEFQMGGAAPGIPGALVRLARRANREALRAYGNSVVPQVVEVIGGAIMREARKQEEGA